MDTEDIEKDIDHYTFADMELNDGVLASIKKLGFKIPTPIQIKAIPIILEASEDLIALAQTGTGKTAAFGLPAINLTDLEDKRTQTIVLCPTRELCLQITRDLESYSTAIKGIGIVAVYGGASIDTQIRALRKNAQIVVGTPGRVKDLIKRKKLILGHVRRVILDEADEMLTMGFKDDMEEILAETPKDRQTLLFSATMSKRIIPITKNYMYNPKQISVARVNVGAENLAHVYYMVQSKHKYEVLKRIADSTPDIYGIVFCRTRRETMEVANKLMQDGYNADVLNGDLSQNQRDEVMGKFRKRHLQILVATDVAARGLDVDDLTHVINYTLPDDPEVYTHRSGRTGRAGKSGISIAIINTRSRGKIRDIERYSSLKFTAAQVPTGEDICQKQLIALVDKMENIEVDEEQIEPFMADIYAKLENLSREDLIKRFVSTEFNRFLKYYRNARDINVGGDGRDGRKRDKMTRSERQRHDLSRLFINAGSKNSLSPKGLITLINEALDSGDAMIGKIEVLKKFSFFEIDKKVVEKLKKGLIGQEFNGITLNLEESNEKPNYAKSRYDSPYTDVGKSKKYGKKKSSKYSRGGDRSRRPSSKKRR